NKEMSVTIKNKEKKSVSIKPSIVIQPYGEYMMEKEWVAVTPGTADIPAGGSQKFTVKVSIPKDASLGYYNAQVAFTDEEIPSPYPQPIPNYVHTYQLSVDVWTPPNVQILRSYITDQLESGKEYDYIIKLKNVADKAIPIDPKMSDQNSMYYGPYGTMDAAFTDDAISITAPKEIPAGQTVEVKVHIKVPEDAKGSYNGAIDLGISDLSIRDEWADMVNLQFGVWKQPSEPFVKSFTTDDASPVTIEVSSNLLNGLLGYIGYPGTTSSSAKTPSFTVGLNGPANEPISLKKTKTLIKGGVSLGGMGTMYPPWESESEGIYNEIGVQYVETFTTNVPKGDLKLSILPRNTQGFEYTITIGE
ncbi:MAG: hypothetical protein KKI06_02130, partial [Euryarchaeota archaeon]|nr:hypothetical protein [Euryarchaeota archaeon]